MNKPLPVLIDELHDGFAVKDRNLIHYFESGDVFFPETYCDKHIESDDYINNYRLITVTNHNLKLVCEKCLKVFRKEIIKQLKLNS